jgi:hypothetical protein
LPRLQRRPGGRWPALAYFGSLPVAAEAGARIAAVAERSQDRLDSWKEIAAYLTRGVRTVRRWEREEGLPVHRHVHRVLGSVYAYKSEIEAWRQARHQVDRRTPVHEPEHGSGQ